jgi:tryptophanyl-tRNA synthetase
VSFREDDGSFRFACWRPMASNCCCRATLPTAKRPAGDQTIAKRRALDVRTEALSFSVWLNGAAVADSAEFADSARAMPPSTLCALR